MRIGVDMGGTKIEAVALADDGSSVLARHRVPTPRDDYGATLRAVADLVELVATSETPGLPVGVATPGAISPATGVMKNANSTWLNGMPLQRDLAEALGRPVRLANDADCFALSEAVDGAAAGARIVFGVILGTGVGGGLVIDGGLVSGPNAITGEWGHNPLPWPRPDELPGARCYCGKHGCIETFLSGPGFTRDHRAKGGGDATPERIVADAASGDPTAAAALARYQDRLARGLAHVINIIDPDVIVVGGGMSNIEPLYGPVSDLLADYVFSDLVATRLVRNSHGDSSGVRGAAWLWPDGRMAP